MEEIYKNSYIPFQTSLGKTKKIVYGKGNVEKCKNKVFVLFDWPTEEESKSGEAISSEQNKLVDNIFRKSGLNPDKNVYYSYVFKIKPGNFQKITFDHFRQASIIVCKEFDFLKPRVVLCFGKFSTTLAIAAHMNVDFISIDQWRKFELYKWVDYSKFNKEKDESYERYKTQHTISESINKQINLFNKNDIKDENKNENIINTMSIADKQEYKDTSTGLYLLSVNKVKGVRQSIYKKSILHTCWAIAQTNPYVAKSTSDKAMKSWITDLENIKTDLVRPAPIVLQQIEDIKAQEFVSLKKQESKYTDLVERLLPKVYTKNGKRLREKYNNGNATLKFQILSMEFMHETNEFAMFGKTQDNESIYCRVPHRHSEFINGFFIKYPKCWRDKNNVKKQNVHFNYEKCYEIETRNHESFLKKKTEQLKKMLLDKLTKSSSFKNKLDLFAEKNSIVAKHSKKSFKKLYDNKMLNPSICTKKLESLCNNDLAPSNWLIKHELSNIKLEFEKKDTFKSYNTQKKPRIFVSVKYKPFQKLALCCLKEIIEKDSEEKTKNEKEQKIEKIKVYEIDCSDTQRFCLNYGIYIGGWVEVKANGYQFVPEQEDPCFSLLPQYKNLYKPTYFNGYKKSFCDIEVITFSNQLIGHNPNLELDLKNEEQQLKTSIATINKEMELHRKQFEEFCTKKFNSMQIDDNTQKQLDSKYDLTSPSTAAHPKYKKWIEIQERRKKNITERLNEIDNIIKSKNIKQWSLNMCQKTLIMDIECMTNGKTFPRAEICPIISMVGYVVNIDENLKLTKKLDPKTGKKDIDTGLPEQWEEVVYFTIGCLDDKESRLKREQDIEELGKTKKLSVFSFRTEFEMLRAWLMFRSDRDFDLEIGHNNEKFDLPYLMDRIRYLGIFEQAPYNCIYGTRKMFEPINIHKVSTFSKAFGAKIQMMIDLKGSSCMDTYTICNKEEKFVSYTLNYIAKKLFNTKKADCPYEAIPGTFYKDIHRLLYYNDKDVAITGRIFLFRNSAINSLEFIKLAGCFSQQESFTRGQQFKVLSFIMRSIKNAGNEYPIDTPKNVLENIFKQYEEQQQRDKDRQEKYKNEKAFVLDNNRFLEEGFSDEEDDDNYDHFEEKSDDEDDDLEFNLKNMSMKNKSKGVSSKMQPGASKLGMGKVRKRKQNFPDKEHNKSIKIDNSTRVDRDFKDINGYVEDNVIDQVKKSKRAFTYVTQAQKRKREDKLKPKSKLTKKQQEELKETTAKCFKITDMFGGGEKPTSSDKLKEIAKKRLEDNRKKRKLVEMEEKEAEKLKEAEGPAYKGATCVEPVRGLHLIKRDKLKKEYEEEMFERLKRIYLIDKETGEISYVMKDEFLANEEEYVARFIVCFDFASLYPTVCIAMNTAQDKKLTLRKLIKIGFPIEFCNVSTEKWPDKKLEKDDPNYENWTFFIKSDYQPAILNRCRNIDDMDCAGIPTESLLELFKFIAYNEKYRFLTQIYEKVLLSRNVDLSGIKIADHIKVEKINNNYNPSNAGDSEYKPPEEKDLNFDLYDGGLEYGKYNQSLDEILIKYWDDPLNKKYDINEYPSRGILPQYEESCLAKRKIAKKQMEAAEEGSAIQNAWNGAQLGLKIHANSGYGVTGANEDMGKLGDISISATITGYGRRFLEFVKNWFLRGTGKIYKFDYFDLKEKRYKTLVFHFKNDVKWDKNSLKVRNQTKKSKKEFADTFFNKKDQRQSDYKEEKHGSGGDNYGGDTDSFFNVIHGIDYELVERMGVKQFMKFMQILGDEANAKLPSPVSLQFEKIMATMIFVNKKSVKFIFISAFYF